ncbi:MAG: D-cysteine desulfhydrase family protein [Clostridiales bacterium]|nr:D-cysteine desulfhydrase family protein [Clostridiales bacterium]
MLENKKVSFLHLPTPLEYLPNISESLGVEFYIKRDDLTGLGAGGNKLRKLEYFLKDAQDKEATMLITVGGAQTNHGRLTAAVAAKYGMKCAIVCDDEYPGEVSANILLDRIMGAEVVLHKPDGTELMDVVEDVKKRYEAQGEKVYFIPMGGSNEVGELGYYECAQELKKQCGNGHVITAVGSMGTYMGLFCGLHGADISLTGILIGPFYEDCKAYAVEYFGHIKEAMGLDYHVAEDDFDIREEFIRGGYNNTNEEVRQAIYEMARKEAILLDPCYTGKTYAAIKDMVASGDIKKGEKIIFIHTGGMPGLNTPHHRRAFEEELMDGVTVI